MIASIENDGELNDLMEHDIIDIVDKNDNIVGIATRKEMRAKALRHRTAHLLVFNSKGELFITKRAKIKDWEPGKWEIGQGGVVSHNETYEETAEREVGEELGIEITPANPLSHLFDFRYESDQVRYLAKVFSCANDGPFALQESEIEEGKFISISDLKKALSQDQGQFTEDAAIFFKAYLNSIHEI